MRRDPLVDPPEYQTWRPLPGLADEWAATLAADPARARLVAEAGPALHERLYRRLVRARLVDQRLAHWVRQGRLAKAWLATGEEAATTGPTAALDPARDHVCPVIRNQSACLDFGMPTATFLRAALGAADGPSLGRDLHVGDPARHVWPPVSQMGAMVPVATGLARAVRAAGQGGVVLTWLGDGATKTGAAHEGLNLAGVWRVPLLTIVQANGIALGTPTERQHAAADFSAWPAMYGLHGAAFDGNHVLDAWAAVSLAVAACRAGDGPWLLEARTWRMGGHATHDAAEGARLQDPARRAWFAAREPVGAYECWLVERAGWSVARLAALEADEREAVEAAAAEALQLNDGRPVADRALRGVLAARPLDSDGDDADR